MTANPKKVTVAGLILMGLTILSTVVRIITYFNRGQYPMAAELSADAMELMLGLVVLYLSRAGAWRGKQVFLCIALALLLLGGWSLANDVLGHHLLIAAPRDSR